jgi:hypothetical protein
MASPLWKEWTTSEIFGMGFKRCPNVDEHVLPGFLNAAFNS